jgi:hypothetical protein
VLGQTSRLWTENIEGGRDQLEALLAQVRGFAGLPLPTLMAGHGLTAAGTGDWAGAVGGLAAFTLLTAGVFAGCLVVADRMYMQGWMRMQGSGTSQRSRARAARAAARGGWLSRAPADLAIALKDWRMIPRDLRSFAQLIGPLVLLPVAYINLLGGGGRRSFNAYEEVSELARGRFDPAGIFLAMGVLITAALVFSHVASTSISMEGRSWWLLKAAPITPTELLRGKFLVAFVPFAVLSTVLMIVAALWRGFSPFGLLYGWFGVELIGAGLLAIGLGFAVPWARLDWDDPRRMVSGWGWLFTTIGQTLLGLLAGGLLIVPVVVEAFAPGWTLAAYAAGILGAVAVTAGTAFALLTFAASRLRSVGEA